MTYLRNAQPMSVRNAHGAPPNRAMASMMPGLKNALMLKAQTSRKKKATKIVHTSPSLLSGDNVMVNGGVGGGGGGTSMTFWLRPHMKASQVQYG